MALTLRFFSIAFLCAALQLGSAWAGNDWALTKPERKLEDAGNLLVHTATVGDGYIKVVKAYLKIKAPAADVFTLITDYEHLPQFMPNLERIEVLSHDEDGAKVNYYLGLPFNVKKRYRLQINYDTTLPEMRMSWQSIPWGGVPPEESVKDTQGFWSLTATKDNETLLYYYTLTDPGHVAFGLGWVVEYTTERVVVQLLENTKNEAENQVKNQRKQEQ